MKDLQEKRLESRNKNVFEELQKLAEDRRYREFLKSRFSEVAKNYAAGALNLHLHFTRYSACVEINRYGHGASVNRLGASGNTHTVGGMNGEPDIGVIAGCHESGPMFIDVVQTLKDGQGVTSTEFIRSEAWLKTLDDCQGRFGDSLRMFYPPIIPLGNGCRDGKLPVHAIMTCIVDANESTNQIIERRPHIVNAISDHSADSDRRVWIDHVIDDPRRIIRKIGFQMGFVFCDLEKLPNFNLDEIEMFFRPCDLSVEALHPRQ